jgi:hypothetical protein
VKPGPANIKQECHLLGCDISLNWLKSTGERKIQTYIHVTPEAKEAL